MKRKSSRRSSILKVPRPLEEVQNTSIDERYPKNKRVSFANIVKIKEIQVDQPAHATADDAISKDENEVPATGDADTVIQISTPRGKKRRRISTDTGSKLQRLSIIPKLEQSFCLTGDDFEVYEDHADLNKTDNKGMSPFGSQILMENAPVEEDTCKPATTVNLAQNKTIIGSVCMDLTMQPSDNHSSFSLLSPGSLLDGPATQEPSLREQVSLESSGTDHSPHPSSSNSPKATISQTPQLPKPFSFAGSQPKSILNPGVESQTDTPVRSDADELDITCTTDTSNICVEITSTSGQIVNHKDETCTQENLDSVCADLVCSVNAQPAVLGDELSLTCCSLQACSPRSALNAHNVSEQVVHDSLSLDLTCTTQGDDTLKIDDPSCCNHLDLTHTVAPSKATFMQISTEKDTSKSLVINPEVCGNWLQNTSNEFLVDDPSASSDHAKSSTTEYSMCRNKISVSESLKMPASLLLLHTTPRESGNNIAPRDILDKIKQVNLSTCLQPTIATPEAVQIENPVKQPISPVSTAVTDLKNNPADKSVITSPAALSKFCTFLNCDQTILDTTCFPLPENEVKPHEILHFSKYLEQILTRIIEIEKALQHRLNESSYVNSHQGIAPALNILHSAAFRALSVVALLKTYGEVSATCALVPSLSHSVECLATPPSEDLNGPLSEKIQWLLAMHTLLSGKVYPAVEEVMGVARDVYHWALSDWSNKSVCLSLARECEVTFQLSSSLDCAPISSQILSVHIQSSASTDEGCETSSWKTSLIQCTHTTDIPKALFEAQKILEN